MKYENEPTRRLVQSKVNTREINKKIRIRKSNKFKICNILRKYNMNIKII